ncbi:EAL and HDOD domain-containing protein [Sulfurivirga sp.]|uniref:EAL and HDOD domain-containing protein n=1 Tax=Sulfurivirga sp. TaxID=2614236 RepID=UPI0025D391C9|nr:HDOD domain-containing protein [Sulfurivirga sp.]
MLMQLSQRPFFSRRPIFAGNGAVVAYMGGFVGQVPGRADVKPAEMDDVLHRLEQLVQEIPWRKVGHGLPLVLELPKEALTEAFLRHFPPRRVVIGVDWRLFHSVEWANLYKLLRLYHLPIALLNYDFSRPLVLDDFKVPHVGIDLSAVTPQRIMEGVPPLKNGRRLIAQHVEDQRQFGFCRHYGCDFFTGPFYLKPEIESSRQLRPTQIQVLRLLNTLDDPNVHLEQIEQLLEQDLFLSEQLVRLANRTLKEGDEPLQSIMDALRRIGLRDLKMWLESLVLAELGEQVPEVVRVALTRGHFVRCLGKADRRLPPDAYYTIGLFSLLDVLMKRPLEEILRELNLHKRILAAMLEGDGLGGQALALIRTLEMGTADQVTLPRGVVAEQAHRCYLAALDYADEVMATLQQVRAEARFDASQ